MKSRISISNWQAIFLITLCNISSTVFYVPSAITPYVKQDAWISVLLGSILAAIFLYYPLAYMGRKFPGKTIIQYSEDILGKYPGKLFSLILIYYFFQNQCWSLREFGEVAPAFLPRTPVVVITIIFSLLLYYAASSGVEVISRCGQMVFPIIISSVFFIVAANIKGFNFSHLQPVLEAGIVPVSAAALIPLDWISLGFIFCMLTAFLKTGSLVGIGLVSALISGVLLSLLSVVNILVFSAPSLSRMSFSFWELATKATLPGVERLEVFLILAWVLGIFIRGAVYTYITVLSIAQLFNLKDYRCLLLTESIFAISYALNLYESFIEMSMLFYSATFFYLAMYIGLPFFLWVVSLVRFGTVGADRKNPE